MKFIKYTLILVAVIGAGAVVAGYLSPEQWKVERSVTINAPAAQIFPKINTLKEWPTWTVWTKEEYPEITREYSGPDAGVNAAVAWDDGSMDGSMRITKSTAPTYMSYDMLMNKGEWPSRAELTLVENGSNTTVTWSITGNAGSNPIARLFMQVMKGGIGEDFSTSLNTLKTQSES